MSLILQGSTSGSITLQEPAVAGSTVLDLPATSGTVALTSQLLASPSAVGQIPFSTDGSTYTATAKIVSGTAVASTSGTSIDFTGIPSWVKRVTVMFDQVSTNGTSLPAIQLGDSGGVETTGYNAGSNLFTPTGIGTSLYTTSFTIRTDAVASTVMSGAITFSLLSSSANTWAASGLLVCPTPSAYMSSVSGTKSLSATLDRVRITTVNGTDTFDAGTINILYE